MSSPVFRLIFFIFSLSWLPLTSQAEIDLCTDPYKFICSGNGKESIREQRIAQAKSEFEKAALKAVSKKFFPKADPKTITFENFMTLTASDSKRWQRRRDILREYYGTIQRKTVEMLKNSSQSATFEFDWIRRDLALAVHQTVLDPKIKSSIISKINRVQFIGLSYLLERKKSAALSEKQFNEVLRMFLSPDGCRRDGMADNAFAFQELSVVIVCPGAMIASLNPKLDHNKANLRLMRGLILTLGHEVGHHFDSSVYPNVYYQMQTCYENNFSSEFKEDVSDYMGEISADYWGADVLAVELMSLPVEEKEALVLEALADLCDQDDVDDGVHPTGKFRIETVIFENPQLRLALGCDMTPQPKVQGCNLDGESY